AAYRCAHRSVAANPADALGFENIEVSRTIGHDLLRRLEARSVQRPIDEVLISDAARKRCYASLEIDRAQHRVGKIADHERAVGQNRDVRRIAETGATVDPIGVTPATDLAGDDREARCGRLGVRAIGFGAQSRITQTLQAEQGQGTDSGPGPTNGGPP